MDFQIIRATPEIGQIEVLYKQGDQPVAVYAIDVPIVDGAFLTGDGLVAEIQHRAPVWVTQRNEQVKTATGFDLILAMVQPLSVDQPTSEAQANAEMWAQQEYEQKLAKALVKFGVLSEDPTSVGVTKL